MSAMEQEKIAGHPQGGQPGSTAPERRRAGSQLVPGGWGRLLAPLAVLSLLLLVLLGGPAAGLFWPDITESTLSDYGITGVELEGISQGFADGYWRPQQTMPRRQFVKMALDAFGLPRMDPAVPSFGDVPKGHQYYQEVEGAAAAGLVQGVAPGRFAPDEFITREQAAAVISRFLVSRAGQSLPGLLTAEQAAHLLAPFGDTSQAGPNLRLELAFAVSQGILKGNNEQELKPKDLLTRIQGAALLIRAHSVNGPTTTTAPSTTTTGPQVTTTSLPGGTTTTSPATTTTLPAITTTTLPAITTTTLPPSSPAVFGRVLDSEDSPVAGAQVTARYFATNPGPGGNNLIGSATTDAVGGYEIAVGNLPLGTIVEVSAIAAGYYSVLVFGAYDEPREQVDFASFASPGKGDRRLPHADPDLPQHLLLFEELLPD